MAAQFEDRNRVALRALIADRGTEQHLSEKYVVRAIKEMVSKSGIRVELPDAARRALFADYSLCPLIVVSQ